MSTMTDTKTDQIIQKDEKEIQHDSSSRSSSRNVKQQKELPTVEIEIVGRKGRQYILRDSRNLQIEINKSLIEANGVKANHHKQRLFMPVSLYNIWFGQAEKKQRLDNERRKRALIIENVSLLWRYRKRILDDNRLFFIMIPVNVGLQSFPHNNEQLPLGILVKAWDEYEDIYSRMCPRCGGKMLVWNFSGEPMNGTSIHSDVCTKCGYKRRNVKGNVLRDLSDPIIDISRQYQDAIYPDAMTLEDAIESLKRADTDL